GSTIPTMTPYSKCDTGIARTGPGGKKVLAKLEQACLIYSSGVGRSVGCVLAARCLIGKKDCCINALAAMIVLRAAGARLGRRARADRTRRVRDGDADPRRLGARREQQ